MTKNEKKIIQEREAQLHNELIRYAYNNSPRGSSQQHSYWCMHDDEYLKILNGWYQVSCLMDMLKIEYDFELSKEAGELQTSFWKENGYSI